MQKYLQATFVAQRDLLLLELRHSHTCNLGVHFDTIGHEGRKVTLKCVVGRGVAGAVVQWARLGGKGGMCKMCREDMQFLLCSLLFIIHGLDNIQEHLIATLYQSVLFHYSTFFAL